MAQQTLAVDVASIRPTGIPWRLKITETLGGDELDMLLALFDAVLPPVQRLPEAPARKSRKVSYISNDEYRNYVTHLRKETVILNSPSAEDEFKQYLADKPSDNLEFRQMLRGMFCHLPKQKLDLLARVLWVLNK